MGGVLFPGAVISVPLFVAARAPRPDGIIGLMRENSRAFSVRDPGFLLRAVIPAGFHPLLCRILTGSGIGLGA